MGVIEHGSEVITRWTVGSECQNAEINVVREDRRTTLKKKAESQQRSSLASDELTFRGSVSVASVPALTLYLHSEKTKLASQ